MTYTIRHAAVIGAGTMGAGLAAHLAGSGLTVTLLDIVPPKLTPEEEKKGLSLKDAAVRDRFARTGLDRALQSRPASFYIPDIANRIRIGNLEDDFELLKEADWVLEAIVEDLKIKQVLMARLEAIRKPNTIISTNTSGIPVSQIAQGRSDDFRRHFLGTHFFNPPRYLPLLEIIPTTDTAPEVTEFMRAYGTNVLGKGVVIAKDTPNFIANRVGTIGGIFLIDYALRHGYTLDEVDALTGPLVGHPKTATFRLFDLVGIDVLDHVIRNLHPAVPDDEQRALMASPLVLELFKKMVDKNWLGGKTNQGFYKEVRVEGKKDFWTLNLKTMDYEAPSKPRFESVGKAREIKPLGERLKALLAESDRAAELLRQVTYHGLAYASNRIPEISDDLMAVDLALKWGFMHEAGPFETWDALGVAETVEKMEAAGHKPAAWVREMLAAGCPTFYKIEAEEPVAVYDLGKKAYRRIAPDPGILRLAPRKKGGGVIEENSGASLVDIGDRVACLEFHTKMNALDTDIWDVMARTLDRLDAGEFEGLVIGNEADNFCAGANIFLVAVGAQNKEWEQLEKAIRGFQLINQRIRYSTRPIAVAVAGLAIGGGCEITMACPNALAAAESYIGLVEVGVGLIPAGGGCKEMVRRILSPAMRTKGSDPLVSLQRIFEMVGQAKVATSAEEARAFGFLSPGDRMVMNRAHLLAEAKREVLYRAKEGYRPPIPLKLYAAGRDALSGMQVGVFMFKESGFISEHDALIGNKLANILCGGPLSQPTWVDEQYFLDLECEAFLSLCGEAKTQERIWHMLKTGKPLRN